MDSRHGGQGGSKGGMTRDQTRRRALLGHLAARCSATSRWNVWGSSCSSSAPHHCGDGGAEGADYSDSSSGGCGGVGTLRKSAWFGQKDGVLANSLGIHQVRRHVVSHRAHYDPFQQHQAEPQAYKSDEKRNYAQPGLLAGPEGAGPAP